MAKVAFNMMKTVFTTKLGLNLWNKLVKFYICNIEMLSAETWTLRTVDGKHVGRYEM
jgi:hypothetical protein